MIKKILIGVLLLGIIIIMAFYAIMSNFEIFDEPNATELKTECDLDGLRKIIMSEFEGNAVTNRSIHITTLDCNYEEKQNAESIFIADAPNIKSSDVNFEWNSLDTLTIIYNKDLRVFLQESESKTVSPKIVIQYIIQ